MMHCASIFTSSPASVFNCCHGNGFVQGCLRDSRLDRHAIEHVNAHATSTPQGDRAEIAALSALFGAHTRNIRIAATKGNHGHLLGATGAIETIFTVLSCHFGRLPPMLNLDTLDPEIAAIQNLPHFVTGKPQDWTSSRRIALKNAFGFGGTNASVAISNYTDD